MPNSRHPTVSIHLVGLMEKHLVGRGVPVETFRRQVGVTGLELDRPDGRLDIRRYRRARGLVEQLGRLEDFDKRPASGWMGWIIQGWPEIASAWFNSPSLGAAIQAYVRYRPLIGEPDSLTCEVIDDRIALNCFPDSGAETTLLVR